MKTISTLILLFISILINAQTWSDIRYVTTTMRDYHEVYDVYSNDYNGIVSLSQNGNNNSVVSIQQIDVNNVVYAKQTGNDNNASVEQNGSNDHTVLMQKGVANSINDRVSGDNIRTLNVQIGNDNSTNVDVSNITHCKVIITKQYGDNNAINLENKYENTRAVVVSQSRDNNTANITLNTFSPSGLVVHQRGGATINIIRSDFPTR